MLILISQKKNKNNNSIINIQNLKDDIATKQENDTGDKLTIDKASVNDNEMSTAQVENTDQLKGNLTANRHEMNIFKKLKDKRYNNNSGQSYKILQQKYIRKHEDVLDINNNFR